PARASVVVWHERRSPCSIVPHVKLPLTIDRRGSLAQAIDRKRLDAGVLSVGMATNGELGSKEQSRKQLEAKRALKHGTRIPSQSSQWVALILKEKRA